MTAFNDPEIVRYLRTNFVPVATHLRERKRQDADGAFFREMCKHISYWQSGACVFTPDGKVLGACSATSLREVLDLIKSSLPKFEAPAVPYRVPPLNQVDKKNLYVADPPPGTVVVSTMMAHLSERGAGRSSSFDKLLSQTVSIDRLWIRKDEVVKLIAGTVPTSLKNRMSQWHLVNNRTFDQNRRGTVKKFELQIDHGRLTGSALIVTSNRTTRLTFQGFIESKKGKLTRFDMVAHGTRKVGKQASFPIAYAFQIADKEHVAYRVPPYPVLGYSIRLYLNN